MKIESNGPAPSFYGYRSGVIKNPSRCDQYKIDDPNSQILFEDTTFLFKDMAQSFREQSIQIFMKEKYTSKQLRQSIQSYLKRQSKNTEQYLQIYQSTANANKQKFAQHYGVTQEDAFDCCLALSYYTGAFDERVNRKSNVIIKLNVASNQSKIKDSQKFRQMKCIGHWMFKALNYIPLYWGQVTRCVNLDEGQDALYAVGNIITWTQFSSSSYGEPTQDFRSKNTRFIIYSLSGRNIQKFSNYGNQTEVLFKPFSHFLVLGHEKKEGILFIFMREVFFGQSSANILWVNDNVFDPNRSSKGLMELATIFNPLLSIIPKNSTETALAFIRSQLGQNRKPSEFRIISDMTRENENPSYNAGARFVKQLLAIYSNNLSVLIYTGNKAKGQERLKELGVPKMQYIEVTISQMRALDFLGFQ